MIRANRYRTIPRVLAWLPWLISMSSPLAAEQLFQFRNGLVIEGSAAEIATLKDGFGAAAANQMNVRPIWLIDDGLRRIYVHGKGMVAATREINDLERPIEIWQPKPLGGKIVGGLGSILGVSPFNEYGRRVLTIRGPEGPVQVVQGITELNSRYVKLLALKGNPTLSWDMRVATSSMATSELNQIFRRRMNMDDLNDRLEIVRFYISAERYEDARQALQETVNDFPEENDLKPQLTALTERQGLQLLDEAAIRVDAGQYELARNIFSGFPLDAVGRVTRIKVEDAVKGLDDAKRESDALINQLRAQVGQLDAAKTQALQSLVDEIANGLSSDTLSRLSDYSRLGNSDNISLENRIALAISGWLLGAGSGEQNLSVAISLIQVRDLVAEYLGSADEQRRAAILDSLKNLEGSQPEYIDRILPLLTPVKAWPEGSQHEAIAGMFTVDAGTSQYLIQLPPEYNPLRQYPCIVALHESRSSPENQIHWWAGPYNADDGVRMGHAARQGFIVVAPIWARPDQRTYEYTPQEHQRVLVAVRDAMRRSSIDSDRVFLAGHGEGGTAAWDIALAHPDLWAGMIAISASPAKTVPHYEPNARYVPLYMVMGELDGMRADGSILDDYMSFNHDAMVVMYRGRGREYFYDEIPRMFEWMKLPAHQRRPIPRDINTASIRTGDQFFWWLEMGDLKPDVAIDPILWDQAKRIRAGKVEASIGTDNQIRISGPAEQFQVLLRPQEGIDLAQPVVVRYGSRTARVEFDGSIQTLLEDARQRADRKRAFWVAIPVP
jgi:pimeloyl-ACP methyl ester carboxylesterase